jgi:HAD superfamily hydrolase (TIGR01484 family)
MNKDIPKEQLSELRLAVFDSDGVMVERGTEISQFCLKNKQITETKVNLIDEGLLKKLQELSKRMLVCISSGRSLIYLQEMYRHISGKNIILMAENGNLFMNDGEIIQLFTYSEEYFKKLARIRDKVSRLPISGIEPKQFILTIHAVRELKEVYEIVRKEDYDHELKVMWNGEAFDIQRADVSKGKGLETLMAVFKIAKIRTIAIGDRVNDKELLDMAGVAVSADNKQLPAKYYTTSKLLGGKELINYLLKETIL